jgi:hypothetical protein
LLADSSPATDRDGGDDCLQTNIEDWGDAPEGVLAYPGVVGKFPTCRDMSLVGTQEIPPGCPPLSTSPHVTGHIFHAHDPSPAPGYWLGCSTDSAGAVQGIDSEPEGKVNEPPAGTSFCAPGLPGDCVEGAFTLAWDQDECYLDGSDAGLTTPPTLVVCESASLTFNTYNCDVSSREVFLNILIDMNHDGDWNDAELCGTACAYEWVVKNATIVLPPGCGTITSPGFLVGPTPGPAWIRISLTDVRVTDDYPWAGGAGHGGFTGGETEDYPMMLDTGVPVEPTSWGKVKARYGEGD